MKTVNLSSSVVNDETKGSAVDSPIEGTETTSRNRPRKRQIIVERAEDSGVTSVAEIKQSKLRCIIQKIAGLPPVSKVLLTGLFCGIIVLGGAAFIYFGVVKEEHPLPDIPQILAAKEPLHMNYVSSISIPVPTQPRDTPNPINGELFTKAEYDEMKERYPLAVIIENQLYARPQSGYNSADIVFEALAEGGITRSIAVFWGHSVDELGPIRSLRLYFAEWVMPFDSVIMHIGYAESDDALVDVRRLLTSGTIKSLDRGGTFWRSSERFAPHNAYSSTELLYQKASDYGYTGVPDEIEAWQFKRDAALDDRGTSSGATLVFFERLNNGGLYDITWTYDRDRNVYIRKNGGTAYTDENTGEPVYAKNVIIQRVVTESTYDHKAHMIITTIGNGDAIILRDGVAITGTWEKTERTKRTRYYDSEGNEIEFNRGITWVEAVPIDQGTVQIAS